MADEYPVKPTQGRPVGTPAPATPAVPAPATHRPPRFPDDPDAARAEIAATRARMSDTIDEIEDVLLRKKAEIRDKLDVMEPVREQPLRSLAMVFGAALLLGLITGGSKRKHTEVRYVLADGHLRANEVDDDDDEVEEDFEEADEDPAALAWERAEEWEDRAHRLLRIARAQESELELHRSRRSELRDRLRALRRAESEEESFDDDHDEDELDGENLFDRVRTTAASRIAALAGDISHRMMRGG